MNEAVWVKRVLLACSVAVLVLFFESWQLKSEVSDSRAHVRALHSEVFDLLAEVAELKTERAKSAQVPAVPGNSSQVNYLARDLEQVQAWADREGAYSLYLLDSDLDRVEKGEKPRGSFTDFFVLNMGSALSAGVPEAEVVVRLERLIALAESGKPLSTYISKLLMEGGADAIRAYAQAKTGVGGKPTP